MDMGRGEQRVRCIERVTWKLPLLHENSQQEFAVWLRKLKQEQEMGGWFKRERIYVYLWLIHVEV